MAEAIPGARLVVIPGAAHIPPLERPTATTHALLEFLARFLETFAGTPAL